MNFFLEFMNKEESDLKAKAVTTAHIFEGTSRSQAIATMLPTTLPLHVAWQGGSEASMASSGPKEPAGFGVIFEGAIVALLRHWDIGLQYRWFYRNNQLTMAGIFTVLFQPRFLVTLYPLPPILGAPETVSLECVSETGDKTWCDDNFVGGKLVKDRFCG